MQSNYCIAKHGKIITTLEGHSNVVLSVAFGPDGAAIVFW